MLTIIFDITKENEVLSLNINTNEILRTKVSKKDADFYRIKLSNEVMIRNFSTEKSNEIIGTVFITTSLSSTDDFFTNS